MLILIIGGFAAGKRDYARTLGYQDEDFTQEIEDEKPVLWGLQELVYQDPESAMEMLPRLLKKQAVICDEVGCGVTPVDPRQRLAREQTGRLCAALAARAQKAVRVCFGIPTVIKE